MSPSPPPPLLTSSRQAAAPASCNSRHRRSLHKRRRLRQATANIHHNSSHKATTTTTAATPASSYKLTFGVKLAKLVLLLALSTLLNSRQQQHTSESQQPPFAALDRRLSPPPQRFVGAPLPHLFAGDQSLSSSSSSSNELLRPFILLASAAAATTPTDECKHQSDCNNSDKICHERKCLCPKDKPIEEVEQDKCLPHAELYESCELNEQCLGDSRCLDGFCSCGGDIVVPNQSRNISYCHPRRALRERCNFDVQCPLNSYCSQDKFGCLCQNGFAASRVVGGGVATSQLSSAAAYNNGVETSKPSTSTSASNEVFECLPKTCSNSSQCESLFHTCIENRCLCDASHFDIKTARCYEFGSLSVGLTDDDSTSSSSKHNATFTLPNNAPNAGDKAKAPLTTSSTSVDSPQNTTSSVWSVFYDLNLDGKPLNGKPFWPLAVLIGAIIAILALLSCCVYLLITWRPIKRWRAQKNEFEPNSQSGAHLTGNLATSFTKNHINNKSFRKKSAAEEDELSARSSASSSKSANNACDEADSSRLVASKHLTKTTTTTTLTTTSIMIDVTDDDEDDDDNGDDDCNYDEYYVNKQPQREGRGGYQQQPAARRFSFDRNAPQKSLQKPLPSSSTVTSPARSTAV